MTGEGRVLDTLYQHERLQPNNTTHKKKKKNNSRR